MKDKDSVAYKENVYDNDISVGTGGYCQYTGNYCTQLGSNVCERCIYNTAESDD